jgi:hypothetical protein
MWSSENQARLATLEREISHLESEFWDSIFGLTRFPSHGWMQNLISHDFKKKFAPIRVTSEKLCLF